MDGILNINKATGMTSHDVVAKIRNILKQKRVGHAGTLDPAASGVLPICIGLGTRVAEYLSESGKAYLADIIFGIVTDTYDSEGSIIRTTSTADLSLSGIEEALQHFLGPQVQLPPQYSAIKIQGQPAYKRLILTHHKNLNRGHFLIDDRENHGAREFDGELILFGSERFPDWPTVTQYLLAKV